MRSVAGQCIVLLYCLLAVLLVPVDTWLVIAFLSVIVYVSSIELRQSEKMYFTFTIFYLILSLIRPQFLLFSPLVFYHVLEYGRYLPGFFLGGMCVFFYLKENPRLFVVLALGYLFSGFIWYETSSYRGLWEQFWKMRDAGTELNLLLEEKNRALLKKQDDDIYTATLKERNRIAREIHDNVGHMLSRSILMVGAMRAVDSEKNFGEALGQLEDTLNLAMTNVRESVHDLYDDSVNLREVLETLAREYVFCEVQLKFDMSRQTPREIKYSFISIVKEALNNAAKHSDATRVKITAREHPKLYQLVIEDNGSQKSEENTESLENIISVSGGIGICNMKDRVRTLGGTIQIQKKQGFQIYITVPKKEETA